MFYEGKIYDVIYDVVWMHIHTTSGTHSVWSLITRLHFCCH